MTIFVVTIWVISTQDIHGWWLGAVIAAVVVDIFRVGYAVAKG